MEFPICRHGGYVDRIEILRYNHSGFQCLNQPQQQQPPCTQNLHFLAIAIAIMWLCLMLPCDAAAFSSSPCRGEKMAHRRRRRRHRSRGKTAQKSNGKGYHDSKIATNGKKAHGDENKRSDGTCRNPYPVWHCSDDMTDDEVDFDHDYYANEDEARVHGFGFRFGTNRAHQGAASGVESGVDRWYSDAEPTELTTEPNYGLCHASTPGLLCYVRCRERDIDGYCASFLARGGRG